MLFEVFYCKKVGHLLAEEVITFSIWLSSRGHCMHSSWKHRTVSTRHLRKKSLPSWKRQISTWSPTLVCPLLPRVPWERGVTSAIGRANCKRVPVFNRIYLDDWSWSFISSFEQEMPFPKQAGQWVTPDLAPAAHCYPAEVHEASSPLASIKGNLTALLGLQKIPHPQTLLPFFVLLAPSQTTSLFPPDSRQLPFFLPTPLPKGMTNEHMLLPAVHSKNLSTLGLSLHRQNSRCTWISPFQCLFPHRPNKGSSSLADSNPAPKGTRNPWPV